MEAITEISSYLIQTLMNLLLLGIVMRLLLQLSKADFYNPISQILVKLTNPMVLPLRRLVPNFRLFDLSSLILAIGLQVLLIIILLKVNGAYQPSLSTLVIWGLIGVAAIFVNIYFFALLAMIILSWLAPNSYHPAVQLISQIVEPIMAPVRRVIPPIGGLDFSPILIFILINIVEILLRHLASSFGLHPGLVIGI